MPKNKDAEKQPDGLITASDGSALTSTFGAGAITSDVTEQPEGDQEVDLSKAKVTIPGTAPAPKPTAEPKEDNSFNARANRAGIGLVRVEGIDFRYVGESPHRGTGERRRTPGGTEITTDNSTFTPLSEVTFDSSIAIADGDGYKYATDGETSWEGVEGLVPSK